MIQHILLIFLITFVPTLELRASIPYGILKLKLSWELVFLIASISNILLAVFVWFFIKYLMKYFLKIKIISQYYNKLVIRTQEKIKPYIHKYGVLGLAVFIGIPLPGSGVYTGGFGAYLLGYDFKEYFIASVLGVLIAAIIVTLVMISGGAAVNLFIKII